MLNHLGPANPTEIRFRISLKVVLSWNKGIEFEYLIWLQGLHRKECDIQQFRPLQVKEISGKLRLVRTVLPVDGRSLSVLQGNLSYQHRFHY